MRRRLVRGGATLAAAAVTWLFPAILPLTAQPQDVTPLEAGRVIERQLARGAEHHYTLTLGAGDYARVIVEQRGVDVVAQTSKTDASVIADFEDEIRTNGQEAVEIVADAPGTYTVAIRAAQGIVVAGGYAISLGGQRTATDADRAIQESRQLRTRAVRLEHDGHFDAARSLLERALAITEAERGRDDVQTAAVAAQLATVYRKLPDDARSEALFERALAILDVALDPDHPATAVVRSRLGELYQKTGQRAKAEPLLRQALDGLERTLGTENRWFVSALMTLAELHGDAGDYEDQEAIDRRALSIMEQVGDVDSSLYATLLDNLGEMYRAKRDYPRAEQFYQRSLAIGARALGDDSYFIATALQHLGIVARERRDESAAQAYYLRALSIRERIVGPSHPDVAQLLNNLAIIYRAEGDIDKSLRTHLRALSIWEHAAGPYQQATLLSAGNIARTYAAAGDIPNAIAYQRRSDAILEKQLALNVAFGSERQKLLFVNSTSERTDRTISLHLLEAPGNPEAASLAALVLLQRKGRVLDAMADTFSAVRQRAVDPRDRELLDQLKNTTAQLARLALRASDPARLDQRQTEIRNLEAQEERLEAELSAHSAEFRAQVQPVTLEAVQAAIPDPGVLLEFAIFRPFNPRADRNANAYGPPHYAAYVIGHQLAPRGFDLGPADVINQAIDGLRQALRDPRRADVKARARTVDQFVMAPLRAAFGDSSRLIVSPDGELNMVPFEALVDEHDRFLIERHAMSYVTSGRDLLRMQVARANSGAPAIFADPFFGEPAPAGADTPSRRAAPAQSARRGVTGQQLSTMYFAPLAATAEEGRAIKTMFPEATLFTGPRATKATLQRVEAPRLLHIASHAFFLQDAAVSAANPLVRSGLALAGANLPQDTYESGILTALEASGLNLWGTQLVTLSACDTGVGEVRNGEGVYGLRRAFVLAGTETLVMSLWPVNDSIARETMVAYYTGLRAGLGRDEALRQSKLAMLTRRVRQHPFYWASFIQSGEWASLTERRQSPSVH